MEIPKRKCDFKYEINEVEQLLSNQNKLDFETPKSTASVHPQAREGVVVVQKTAKIHLGSLINKLGLSTTALNRHEDVTDESSTKMFERQISVDSSRSSQNSESVSNASHRDVIMKKSETKRQSIKKKHAPNPPNIPTSQKGLQISFSETKI